MKKVLVGLLATGLLLTLYAINAGADDQGKATPPAGQPLVREGDFAVNLTKALKLGAAANETEAESTLASAGIAPKSGWMADYPVTPDIVGELRDAVGDAAAAHRIALGKDEALAAFQTIAVTSGLPVTAGPPPDAAAASEVRPAPSAEDYTQPDLVTNYYTDEGPPVVTYYPPPPDYDYLYAWVPYPFWYSSFFFPGYFVLNDFDRVLFFNGRSVICSNHFFDLGRHRFFRVDPFARREGFGFRHDWNRFEHRGFASERAPGRRCRDLQAQRGACPVGPCRRKRVRLGEPAGSELFRAGRDGR